MNTRTFALIWGIVFLVVVASGFIPGMLQPPAAGDPPLAVDAMHGRALGLFPVNILHNLVHLIFGLWGVIAYRSLGAAKTYARVVAVVYAVFAVMGLVPGLNTTFGLVPLHGNDVWLHPAARRPGRLLRLHSPGRTRRGSHLSAASGDPPPATRGLLVRAVAVALHGPPAGQVPGRRPVRLIVIAVIADLGARAVGAMATAQLWKPQLRASQPQAMTRPSRRWAIGASGPL